MTVSTFERGLVERTKKLSEPNRELILLADNENVENQFLSPTISINLEAAFRAKWFVNLLKKGSSRLMCVKKA